WISKVGIENWILTGENRNIIQWILYGEIIWDKDGYLQGIRNQLTEFPKLFREKKLFREFSLFLRRYLQAKEYSTSGHYLDAYSNVLEALHHWARIAIIEKGFQPEVMVWNQVHDINVGIYKLYEELILSDESLDKRVNL